MAFRAPWGPFCVAGGEQRRVLSLKSGHFNARRVSDTGRIAYMVLAERASAGRGSGDKMGKRVMAGYVEKTLAGGEEIIHRANFNWTYSFLPMFWFALGARSLVFYVFLQFAAGVPFAELKIGYWFAGIGAAAGALILLNHMIILITTEIVVTTYRFVYKQGLISRNTQEVSLNKIEEITLHQSIWGRILSYGKLVLRGTGVGVITLPDLDDPIRLRKIIENAKSALREDSRERKRINSDDDD